MGHRPTISDVAALAGVSTATVSRVLNQRPVQAAPRDSVLSAIKKLNYRRSSLARGLREQRSPVLGTILPDIENPFFTTVVRAVQDVAAKSGFLVVICNSDEDHVVEKEYVDLLADQQIAGLIIAPADELRSDVSSLTRDGVPIVLIDRTLALAHSDAVMLDNVEGGEAATAALIKAGHRLVGMIAGPLRTTSGSERLGGYRRALHAAGIRYRQRLVVDGDYRVEGGYRAAHQLFSQKNPPDALFVANNLMTIGALDALEELGYNDSDIPVITFDDVALSPRRGDRSTVGQPAYEMGRTAATLLVERIRGFEGSPRNIRLPMLPGPPRRAHRYSTAWIFGSLMLLLSYQK